MRKNDKILLGLAKIGILTLCAGFFLVNLACLEKPAPVLGPPYYDVLKPSEEVKKNPIGFTPEGHAVVTKEFLLWVYDLQAEVKRLRQELKKK